MVCVVCVAWLWPSCGCVCLRYEQKSYGKLCQVDSKTFVPVGFRLLKSSEFEGMKGKGKSAVLGVLC